MYYPIWLAYATGVLEESGFGVRLVDAPATGLDLAAVLRMAESFGPRLVVVDTSTPSIHNDARVAEGIKHRLPEAYVVMVGPHVSAVPDASLALSPAIDAVARREYDYTILDLARTLEGGGDFSAVLGLSWRDGARAITHNPPRSFIQDLDALPFVSSIYHRHLDTGHYFYSVTRYPEVAILTGRGCPHQCTYCVWPQTLTGHKYRTRSVSNVADEFEWIAQEMPEVREIFIEDDTLLVDKERAEALAAELVSRGNRIAFSANSRADVSLDTLRSLRFAGLRLLCVGFESGDQRVLDRLKKGIALERFDAFREDARKAGVLVHGCFMAGSLGETRESLARTMELARALDPDTAQFFPLMVYPGTEAFDSATREGCVTTDDFREWLTADGVHRSVVSQPGLSASEVQDWCDRARLKFYLRPRYLASKCWQVLRDPGEAGRIWRSARVFAKHLCRPLLRPDGRPR
jgi:anaerobic magnesium-protoporphyrin IX monomethyl ester cyclase